MSHRCERQVHAHAGMQQRARLKALDRFKSNDNAVLVASDVAARGLDVTVSPLSHQSCFPAALWCTQACLQETTAPCVYASQDCSLVSGFSCCTRIR